MKIPIKFRRFSGAGSSSAETQECLNLQFQTNAIFVDNYSIFADDLQKFTDNLTFREIFANMASVRICRFQHSGVSA